MKFNLFVPGRLCLFGEHSDWAGIYKTINPEIEKGLAIVAPTNEGIYADAEKTNDSLFTIFFNDESLSVKMDSKRLEEIAKSDNFFKYAAGSALAVLRNKPNSFSESDGIKIDINKMTLPIKSGLSSSAAVCVLVVRAFSKCFNFGFSAEEEMDLAYSGERETNSRCGRLDQALAFNRIVSLEFENEEITPKEVEIQKTLYFVYAKLDAQKDTVQILHDLNDSFPYPKDAVDKNVHLGLGKKNLELVQKAASAIKVGDAKQIGELMNQAQIQFDQLVAPKSEELKAPRLHSVLFDSNVKKLSLGGKLVGSGGDGSVQFIVESSDKQKELIAYLKKINLEPNALTISPPFSPIKKAIVPAAGYGTRMFPASKAFKKEFLPVVKDGLAVPGILILFEELIDSGIEEIVVAVNDDGKKQYEEFFFNKLSDDNSNKLPPKQAELYLKIQKIAKALKFVIVNEEVSFGYSVFQAASFAKNETVLLCLSDQVYKSKTSESTTAQFLNAFSKLSNSKPLISIEEITVEDVEPYGIIKGEVTSNKDVLKVEKFIEKPSVEFAKKNLLNNSNKTFRVFGQYILTPEVVKQLQFTDFSITKAFESVINSDVYAFIPNSKMFDLGSPESFVKAVAF